MLKHRWRLALFYRHAHELQRFCYLERAQADSDAGAGDVHEDRDHFQRVSNFSGNPMISSNGFIQDEIHVLVEELMLFRLSIQP